jgi:mannosyltransferase OCH1-like enzyme
MIPPRLVRTVPEVTTAEVERFWDEAQQLHPDWECVTHRDPIDPAHFPRTAPHWPYCKSGAQLAGLVRLETLWLHGGIYIDSDIELFRPLDPLLTLACFAAWEDENTVPDAVMGATRHHPAILACLVLAIRRLHGLSTDWSTGNGAWSTGPGVTTTILPFADGVTLLGPESFFGVHYSEKQNLGEFDPGQHPDAYGLHHWHASWL